MNSEMVSLDKTLQHSQSLEKNLNVPQGHTDRIGQDVSRQSTKHQAKPEPCPVTTSTQGQMPGLAGPAVAGQGHAQGQMSAPSGEQKGSVGTSATRGNKAIPASSYENECMYRSHVYVSGSGKTFFSYLTSSHLGKGVCYRNWYQYWGHCCLINDLRSSPQPSGEAQRLWWASQVVNETTMTEIEVSISILSWWDQINDE